MADTLIKGERNLTRGELDMEDFSQNNALLFTLCERRIHRIRKRYLRAVMRQDMAWFDTQEVGALTNDVGDDVYGTGASWGHVRLGKGGSSETYAYSTAGGLANEVIAGIRTVMAFNAQPAEIHR
ncbi:unnamed protein product [Strongylus vulgaris]|uniref:ABC transmembrane type-1 domain-containing protein n=1 Tax=Strongylus vulgaris TaxID=40348 RepID=A0A3P7JIC9_STRVU|nr:unnamed protein product [Strongylus vulgaris]